MRRFRLKWTPVRWNRWFLTWIEVAE